MKKIIIILAVLCCMSYAKCKIDDTMKIIRHAEAYLVCDRMPHENSKIIKSELTLWSDNMLQITYTFYDNSKLRQTYTKFNDPNYIDITVSLLDESNIVIKRKDYKDSSKTIQDIYREYRKEHNFISYAEIL